MDQVINSFQIAECLSLAAPVANIKYVINMMNHDDDDDDDDMWTQLSTVIYKRIHLHVHVIVFVNDVYDLDIKTMQWSKLKTNMGPYHL